MENPPIQTSSYYVGIAFCCSISYACDPDITETSYFGKYQGQCTTTHTSIFIEGSNEVSDSTWTQPADINVYENGCEECLRIEVLINQHPMCTFDVVIDETGSFRHNMGSGGELRDFQGIIRDGQIAIRYYAGCGDMCSNLAQLTATKAT